MMASAKRKQDEKHLKILRELVSQVNNKECFDCRQRGPTYVNMTIGSFVCTSCSGMLRGLTPPHRVKSISMATFTQDEIEFMKERGNEHCRRIWLGLVNANNQPTLDTKDEQKMKDLMTAKYELKRYYLDPSMASDNSPQPNSTTLQRSNAKKYTGGRTNQSIPRVPIVGTLPVLCTPNGKKKNSETADNFTADFADFSRAQDSFISSNRFSQPIEQPSFANFDNNPAFDSTQNAELSATFSQSGKTMSNFNGINAPPSEDRYAALKDLDSMMKKTQLKDEGSAVTAPSWNNSNSLWGNDQSYVISNPFTAADTWRPSLHAMNNNNMQSVDNTICSTANPFRQTQFPVNNESQWISFGSQNTTEVHPSSQMMTPLPGKVWLPTVTAYQANPFMVGTGVGNPARTSNNPFL
ncbi:arf-GAP domain and FG repeat-containing protein 1 isoform X1 [Fopius arisanus]|uniref:Arf-GAP domain and FG repeat-containing protein 1 isoform X1 n=2 Tax=Fopius arisanus TaxID=64838 RepID=A0A9R1T863_9HYME|nr:PREDICTED: arf-GAP domain and FG repeat-containing protein 1 isoform X1 [Fopius arisanus]